MNFLKRLGELTRDQVKDLGVVKGIGVVLLMSLVDGCMVAHVTLQRLAKIIIDAAIAWLIIIALFAIPIGYVVGNIFSLIHWSLGVHGGVAFLHVVAALAFWSFYLWPALAVVVGNANFAIHAIIGESEHSPVKKYDPFSDRFSS